MFDLRGFVPRSAPDMKDETTDPVMLVSVEDIYRALGEPEHAEPVLLLKKGMEVASTQLPRFIKNGADPSQFRVKASEPLPYADFTPSMQLAAQNGMTRPMLDLPGNVVKAIRSQKRVLVLDPEQKSLKRLIDCLFICGFQLGNLHPLRVPSHLPWAMNKYAPQILVVDYRLSEMQSGIHLLQRFSSMLNAVEHIILTIPPRQDLTAGEMSQIESLCRTWNVKILQKPVNRHTLKAVLDRMLCETTTFE